jgi:uncharacterized repeat protein (TIGR03803 family)
MAHPYGQIVSILDRLRRRTANCLCRALLLLAVLGIFTLAAAAQTFKVLVDFNGTNGDEGYGLLVQGTNGDLYGIAAGGANNDGTIFKITTAGTLTTLYNFCSEANCADGEGPLGLTLSTNGNLYGTTYSGGANGGGTFFEMTPAGKLTTLYSFCAQTNCADGNEPSSVIQGSNGNFYGTTYRGGTGCSGCGTAFEITPAGVLTTLHSFCTVTSSGSDCADGSNPNAALIQATNGNFYGTTLSGEDSTVAGTAFEITPAGKLTTLHVFCALTDCDDGDVPYAPLVQASNGDLYGTTNYGGRSNAGVVFEMTLAGAVTPVYSFCSESECADGTYPIAGLFQGTDGNLYGTTTAGGLEGCGQFDAGCGTAFSVSTSGTFTLLHTFCSETDCADGGFPYDGIMQATNGTFYGTTAQGGDSSCGQYGCGTVYSLSNGLKPFVETVPVSGKVGSTVRILGYGLTGTTSVTFNGTAATFTVISGTMITATVPSGATTGTVSVTTPKGTLSSNVKFRIP